MLMADAVSKLAAKTPGKEAVAMEAFAKALRQVSVFFPVYTHVAVICAISEAVIFMLWPMHPATCLKSKIVMCLWDML